MPPKRVWPLKKLIPLKFIVIWSGTFLAFGTCIVLGVLDWNALNFPSALRFGLGVPLILIGHIAVYLGAKTIGLKATSGAMDKLRTDGLYRYSRNPQYLADMSSLTGWWLLCASFWVLPLALGIIGVFALAPISEETWLQEKYGQDYENYRRVTPRFF